MRATTSAVLLNCAALLTSCEDNEDAGVFIHDFKGEANIQTLQRLHFNLAGRRHDGSSPYLCCCDGGSQPEGRGSAAAAAVEALLKVFLFVLTVEFVGDFSSFSNRLAVRKLDQIRIVSDLRYMSATVLCCSL